MRVPAASVVIPAFNAARTIAASVGSALAQSMSNLEVIVVNDGSTDATADAVNRIADSRVRLVSQANRGLPAARNAGIRASHGTYIAFLDSDDLLLPDFLECGLEGLSARLNPGLAYTDAYVLDEANGRLRESSAMAPFDPPVPPPERNAEFFAALMRINFVYVSTIVPRERPRRGGAVQRSADVLRGLRPLAPYHRRGLRAGVVFGTATPVYRFAPETK